MAPDLSYLLNVNAGIAFFCVFYLLLCTRDTLFVWRRAALLSFVAASFLLPLVSVEWLGDKIVGASAVNHVLEVALPEVVVGASDTLRIPDAGSIFAALYCAGMFVLAVRTLVRLTSVCRLFRMSSPGTLGGMRVRFLREASRPFSFFRWIFVYRESPETDDMEEILVHEGAHVRQWHSVDVLLMEIITIVCWWNPFAWLMRSEVLQNLEYLADRKVVESGFAVREYQYHLIGLSSLPDREGLINHFNLSYLKKRIIMMNRKRTSGAGCFKYALFAFPAFALLMLGNMSCTSEKKQSGEQVEEQTIPAPDAVKQQPAEEIVPVKEKVYEVVDVMPEFPGGVKALLDFISTNVQYPETARQKGIEGRVVVQCVVEKDGSINEVKVLRGIVEELDEEAVRVVNSMPKWTPASQGGQPVRCKYTLPISFKLQ